MEFPSDFLHVNNTAGQTLLKLVSRGSSILAEMLRLSDHIPGVFTGQDIREQTRYKDIIFDFEYLNKQEILDSKIESNEALLDLDDTFRENHIDILQRFYELFESIVRYHRDLLSFISQVKEGAFLQYSLESLLTDTDGVQLMSEGIYLYGVMLILLDLKITGHVREKIVMLYYRYKPSLVEASIRDVVKLCRSTGMAGWTTKRPKNYPEQYFARFPMPPDVIDMVVGRLRGFDIYNAQTSYPSPKHRTTMLATQASMLYVILYFAPHILDKQEATMRGIVDRHFNDNWMIPIYMGILVDLNDWWEPYKAAKLALKNTMDKVNVEGIIESVAAALPRLRKSLQRYLTDGVLTEEYVMDNLIDLLNSLRDMNVTLRWIMLHQRCGNDKLRKRLVEVADAKSVLLFLMRVAQFEFKIKTILQELLKLKKDRWNEYKKECHNRMIELSEFFSGEKPLARMEPNKKLQEWFKSLAEQIASLDVNGNSNVEGRKILKLVNALDDVQKFHQIDNSLQIKQFLSDTKAFLQKMVRTVNVRDEVLGTVTIVSDFSYAWEIMNNYVDLMQTYIKKDPQVVLWLRATFLKMVSILDQPLVRINQCNSEDLVSVSAYYSERLVAFVSRVLDIVPKTMFDMLAHIAVLRQTRLPTLELKFERKYLKDKALLDVRYELAETTHDISVFTEGILNMKTTLFGVIEVEPQQLLEDGIRKELVSRIANALNNTLKYPAQKDKKVRVDLDSSLITIGDHLNAFKQSFEHIQDYVKVYGLKVWQEEFSRIINYYVEQESNRWLRRGISNDQSIYQSEAIPIPQFLDHKTEHANNFTGRVANELLDKTHFTTTVYVDFQQAWVNPTNSRVSVGIRTFNLVLQGLGVVGLNGLDQLIGFMIVHSLQRFIRKYTTQIGGNVSTLLSEFNRSVDSTSGLMVSPKKEYTIYIQRSKIFWKIFEDCIFGVGQKQLIRRQIKATIQFQAKIDSKMLVCSLETMNDAILHDIKAHYRQPTKPYPSDDNPVLGNLDKLLDFLGISDPTAKIYVTSDPLEGLATLLFFFVIATIERLQWFPEFNTLAQIPNKNKEGLDGTTLAVGVLTLLKQFHPTHTHQFIALLCQYVRSYTANQTDTKQPQVPLEARKALHFIEMLCKYGPYVDRKDVQAFLPPYLIDNYPQTT